MHRVTIFVRTHGGEEQRVGWWPPASPRSLRRAIAAALAIPLPLGSEARLTLRDGDGHLVPLEQVARVAHPVVGAVDLWIRDIAHVERARLHRRAHAR